MNDVEGYRYASSINLKGSERYGYGSSIGVKGFKQYGYAFDIRKPKSLGPDVCGQKRLPMTSNEYDA